MASSPKRILLFVFVLVAGLSFLSIAGFLVLNVATEEPVGADAHLSLRERLNNLSNSTTFRTAYINANGGEKRLDELQGILSSGTFESGGQTVPFRAIKRRPNQSVTTLKMPKYDLSFIVNGDQIWQRVEAPGQEPIDSLLEGQQGEAMREMGYFFDPLMHVVLLEPEDITSIIPNIWEGQACLLLEFNSGTRNMAARVYIDALELTPIARVENFADGSERKVLYGDYRRNAGGTLEPHLIETFLDDELQNRVVVETIRPNPGVVGFIFEYTGDNTSAANASAIDAAIPQ